MNSMARRMFELVEPIGVIPYSADEPNEAMFALGFTNYWDTYFPPRGAPRPRLGGAGARALLQLRSRRGGPPHPKGLAHDHARGGDRRSSAGLCGGVRRILGDHVDAPAFAHATRSAARSRDQRTVRGPAHARHAARHSRFPTGWSTRFFHAASLLPRAPGDGHIATLRTRVSAAWAHVLFALAMGMPTEKFGRIHHLPQRSSPG